MVTDYRTITAADVADAADGALRTADALVAKAVAGAAEPTFASVMAPLELALAAVAEGYGRGGFMGHVHPAADVREAGNQAEVRITSWRVGLPFRDDLFRAVAAFAATEEAAALTGEEERLVSHWMRDFRRAGQELDPNQRAELQRLRTRLVELEVAFARNLSEIRDWIEVDRDELDGLSDSFVERLSPGDRPGTYRVSLDYPELTPFLSRAHDRARREELLRKDWNHAVAANRPLLAEALEVRRQIAVLLGHPTWAHYAMEVKMAGAPERVEAFYAELRPSIARAVATEMAMLEARAADDGLDGGLQVWDWLYYDTIVAREDFGVDQEEISEYLPLASVLDGLFALTGDMFGLEYRRVDEARAWHPEVDLFEIRDRASGELLAHFYTDLHPREGKFGHAAAFPLVVEHRAANGSRVTPVSAIVANLTPAAGDRPSLLRHGSSGEVESLFHEFGHILHMSLSTARFARFSAAETEWDFVEAPSQITEHWAWEPEVLARFARHHRTGDTIPADLVERLVRARYLNVGLRAARQIFFGTMDQALHTASEAPDMDAVLRDAFAVTGVPYPEGTFMAASFGHLMGGYDAGYYGYLWAEVIGDDLWGRFTRDGILNQATGRAYRTAILEPNGARSGDDMIRDFLGRDPSPKAYLALRGLRSATEA